MSFTLKIGEVMIYGSLIRLMVKRLAASAFIYESALLQTGNIILDRAVKAGAMWVDSVSFIACKKCETTVFTYSYPKCPITSQCRFKQPES